MLSRKQDQQGQNHGCSCTVQEIFGSDIVNYLIVDHSFNHPKYVIVDCCFTYVIDDYYSTLVFTVWLDSTIWRWSVEASSYHSADGRKPENSCNQPVISEWASLVPGMLNDAKDFTNVEILAIPSLGKDVASSGPKMPARSSGW